MGNDEHLRALYCILCGGNKKIAGSSHENLCPGYNIRGAAGSNERIIGSIVKKRIRAKSDWASGWRDRPSGKKDDDVGERVYQFGWARNIPGLGMSKTSGEVYTAGFGGLA